VLLLLDQDAPEAALVCALWSAALAGAGAGAYHVDGGSAGGQGALGLPVRGHMASAGAARRGSV
jgi:hypothetical protein